MILDEQQLHIYNLSSTEYNEIIFIAYIEFIKYVIQSTLVRCIVLLV